MNIKSRNQREGLYAGRFKVYNVSAGRMSRASHRRSGSSGHFMPLRHPGEAWTPPGGYYGDPLGGGWGCA